ncbi:MAG TPA: hypothetical protein DFS52_06165 [Myxococcales bacterium]|nr:hypothetical protein [Myxococcales bacterium]
MNNFLRALKKYLSLLAFGALAGMLVCLAIAPGVLEWWATPDIPETVCHCEKHVALAMQRLARIQGYGALAAALLTAVGGAVVTRVLKARARRKELAGEGTTSPASPPSSAGT